MTNGDSDSEAGRHAPRGVVWVARLATSHPTEVGEEWGESTERAITIKVIRTSGLETDSYPDTAEAVGG